MEENRKDNLQSEAIKHADNAAAAVRTGFAQVLRPPIQRSEP